MKISCVLCEVFLPKRVISSHNSCGRSRDHQSSSVESPSYLKLLEVRLYAKAIPFPEKNFRRAPKTSHLQPVHSLCIPVTLYVINSKNGTPANTG